MGGYGRGELAPYSDLDVVLVSDEGVELGDLAERVWYPLWDSGARLDHSVRTFPEMLAASDQDLKVALGLLDIRHLAGDTNLTLRLRTTMLTGWRRQAKERLPALQQLVRSRHELLGELAHLSVPDLKEAAGGLRDANVLKALVASWLVDVPHQELERCRRSLLDVRDVLQAAAGRATDRVAPELWDELAVGLELDDEAAAQVHVRELGRRIAHLSRLTWRRVDAVLARPASATGVRRPALTQLSPGIALSAGEVVLDPTARPARDPLMLLRAAATAAEQDVVLAPATAARLVRECPPLPDPWPSAARHLLVRLLASGRGLLAVWETLEETEALPGILPEWERIRLLPHASEIHRFTVDRHVVETCIEAVGPDPPRRAPRRTDGGGAAPRHRQGRAHRAQRRGRAARPRDRHPDGLRLRGRGPDRHPGALAPAARRRRHDPGPRRPGHGRVRRRPGRPRRGHVAAAGADRGRRAGHLPEGVVDLAGGTGARPR